MRGNIINWNDYQQQALSTAIYPLSRELDYTILGLCSEVGELGEAYSEGKQGYGFSQPIVSNVLSEAGDNYWYCAAIADALKTPLQEIVDYFGFNAHSNSRGLLILEVVGSASNMAGILKKSIRDNDGYLSPEQTEKIKLELGAAISYLDALVRLFGSAPEAVTQKNLTKLADRKSRGVLQGSGDTR